MNALFTDWIFFCEFNGNRQKTAIALGQKTLQRSLSFEGRGTIDLLDIKILRQQDFKTLRQLLRSLSFEV